MIIMECQKHIKKINTYCVSHSTMVLLIQGYYVKRSTKFKATTVFCIVIL